MEQKALQFRDQYNNQHIDEDGYYGAQCWDVVARYAREKYGCPSLPTGSGGAEGLFRVHAAPITQYFDVVANNPNDANQVPPNGAIIVWSGTWSPPWGHTAIKLAGGVGQLMTVFEQNGNNPGGNAYQKQRNYTGVSGWLVPKQGVDTVATIPDQDNWFNRFNKLMIQIRGRGMSRDEFRKNFVGTEIFHMVEILSDSGEADTATQAQTVGQLAIKDNWQQQIYGLQDALKSANAAAAQANADLTAARQALQDLGSRPSQADVDKVTAQLADAETRAMKAQADYEKAHADLLAAQDQTAKDTETGNAFLRFIGKLFNGGK